MVNFQSGQSPLPIRVTFNDAELCHSGRPATTTTTTPGIPTTTTPSYTAGPPGKYNYGEVLGKSLLFYEANRSGRLPSDNRVPWRSDSALSDQIQGGYYDAGDHVKFGFPMAAMTTVLAWGAIAFPHGYEKSGQTEWMTKCLKWSTDYFIAAHTGANEFYGQVGDGYADHGWWGRPEEMSMDRPAFKIDAGHPGSDLAGETAAALAAASMWYRMTGDEGYADTCIEHAKQLYDFADQHRGVYTDTIPASGFYNSWSGYNDELVWGAAWLYKATGEESYLSKAEKLYQDFDMGGTPSEFGWDDKKAGVQILMYELTGDSKYKTAVDNFLNYIWSCDKTPQGLVWISSSQWGSLRYAADLSFIALQAAELGVQTDKGREWAEGQINYILGDTGRSYVVGWGNNPPQRPHHRGSSCPDRPQKCDWDAFNSPGPNPQILTGALVGGPDHNDYYEDNRQKFEATEVATDYNAGFQSSLAALASLHE